MTPKHVIIEAVYKQVALAWNLFRQKNNNVGLITWKSDKEKFPVAS